MSMTEAASESRRIFNAAVAKAPARAAEARATLNQLSDKARDMAARAQARARDQLHRRRSLAADQLESLAGALRPEDEAKGRRKAIAIAGGSSLALVAVLGTGVALGLMLSRQLKRRAEQRAAEATALKDEESPPLPQAVGQDPASAGLNL